MPDGSAAARHVADAYELPSLGIEADQPVGIGPGLGDPDLLAVGPESVGTRPGTARVHPFFHLAGRWIESAEVAAGVVTVPDDSVIGDRDAPGTGIRRRQGEFF